jgi:hypothetical protein
MLAVALLSAGGFLIAGVSLARFMRAGHSSIGRLLGPAARLVALATACLFPAAIALRAHSEWLAIVAGALAIAAYYVVVLRSAAASRLLGLPGDVRVSGASP